MFCYVCIYVIVYIFLFETFLRVPQWKLFSPDKVEYCYKPIKLHITRLAFFRLTVFSFIQHLFRTFLPKCCVMLFTKIRMRFDRLSNACRLIVHIKPRDSIFNLQRWQMPQICTCCFKMYSNVEIALFKSC